MSTLEKFHLQISKLELYPKDSNVVEQLLYEMATKPIVHVAQKEGGTQLKLVIDYSDDLQALFKPMSRSRELEPGPSPAVSNSNTNVQMCTSPAAFGHSTGFKLPGRRFRDNSAISC
ncbi:hypothetical protein PV325_000487 [Microctonus aethiopoides]|nr:hypothetical protein PV325_000487 [Microctonus aethiopoides]